MEGYTPDYKYIDCIEIDEIVFDDETEFATLFGMEFAEDRRAAWEWDYVCDFSTLASLLLRAGDAGDVLLEKISDMLTSGRAESPSRLDVAVLLGKSLFIDHLKLEVYIPKVQGEDGAWITNEEDSCYIIERVMDDADEEQISPEQVALSEVLLDLHNLYLQYRLLVAMGADSVKARKKAGLKNDMLFRIAEANNALIEGMS